MATDTQKPTDAIPALENPKKTLDSPVPPTANPDRPEDPPVNSPSSPPPSAAVGSAENGSKVDPEDPKATVGAAAADGAAPATAIEKKIRRAERFGISVQLTEEEKRNSRAERFGTLSTSHGSEASKKSEEQKRKARAERFGLAGPSVASDEDARKKARLARFAPNSKTDPKTDPKTDSKPDPKTDSKPDSKPDPLEEEKRKARALRFSNAPSGSLSKVNEKANIEPKAAIAGSAGGGA